DDALDVILRPVGRHRDHDIAIFRGGRGETPVAARQDVEAGRNPAPAIRIFAHYEPVAHQQAGHHRFRWDVERLGHETVKAEHRDQHQCDAADFRPPVDLAARRTPGRLLTIVGEALLVAHFVHSGRASITTKAWAHG